jgi:hypothetical protein
MINHDNHPPPLRGGTAIPPRRDWASSLDLALFGGGVLDPLFLPSSHRALAFAQAPKWPIVRIVENRVRKCKFFP